MGSVYTWHDVSSGHIPSLSSFETTATNIRERLLSCKAIRSAVLCGSVLRGDYNRRSDIDCVVLYEIEEELAAIRTMQYLGDVAKELHVPLNFVPVDSDLATSSMHHLGLSFVHHIKSSIVMGGLIKGDLPDDLTATQTVSNEVCSYVRAKVYNLEEGWSTFVTFSEERQAAFLKKVLESPLHIARKVLHFHGLMTDDSKQAVRNQYSDWAHIEMCDLFEQMLALDDWYSEQLEHFVVSPIENDYLKCWDLLVEAIPVAIKFARLNALKLDESLG